MKTCISELRPILSALSRSSAGAFLVALQIAFALAVVANTLCLVVSRVQAITRSSGMDAANTFFVESSATSAAYDDVRATREDLQLIRARPGVLHAASISIAPMSGSIDVVSLSTTAGNDGVTTVALYYDIDEHALDAMGVRLFAGRNFTRAEISEDARLTTRADFASATILTRDLARALYGSDRVVGRTLHDGRGHIATIVGVVENLDGSAFFARPSFVAFFPRVQRGSLAHYYAVRAAPGQRDALIADFESLLNRTAADLGRAITAISSLESQLADVHQRDRELVFYLGVLMVLMLAISAMAVAALTSFHVTVRTKQIGTRRAIGARRSDIIRYFMLENWLVTTGGVLLGSLLAMTAGHWLSAAYSLPRLQLGYIFGGGVGFWLLGQLAVIVPARRAASISPAIATRTV
jgi:putative ABC transport system permease protein